jgi:restriction endonuclease S subunit
MTNELLPAGWSEEKLGDIADVIDPHPSHRAPVKVENGIPFVGIGDVSTDGSVDFSRARLVSREILNEHSARYSLNELLIGLGRVASVGKVVRLPCAKYEYVISPTLAVIKPLGISFEFLFFALQSPGFQQQLDQNKQGSGRESVGITRLRMLKVPSPPSDEQEKIVEILEEQFSRLDAALSAIQVVRKKAARFRRSLLHTAFNGALTDSDVLPGELPEGWTRIKLGDVCLRVSKIDPADLGREIFKYVDIGSIDSNTNTVASPQILGVKDAPGRARQLLQEGDTVFSTVRPYMKKIAYINESLDGEIASTGFCVFRANAEFVTKGFIKFFASSDNLLEQVLPLQRGVSYPAVRDKDLFSASVLVPPLMEQKRIVEILEEQLSRLDASLALVDEIERKSSALRRSLLHAAFPGELTKEWREGVNV